MVSNAQLVQPKLNDQLGEHEDPAIYQIYARYSLHHKKY